MVIQTCSEVFAVLMQMDAHASFSADTINTLLARDETAAEYSQTDLSTVAANDRTTLPYQK